MTSPSLLVGLKAIKNNCPAHITSLQPVSVKWRTTDYTSFIAAQIVQEAQPIWIA